MRVRRNVAQKGRKGVQGFNATSASLPAPVGGWNARDSLADMAEDDAVELINWFPSTTDVMVRMGYEEHSTGLLSAAQSLLVYNGPTASKLFAAAGSKIVDITSGGEVEEVNYLNLPGADTDFASTPDSVALSITGDIDLRAQIAVGIFRGASQYAIFKGPGQGDYGLCLFGRFLRLTWLNSVTTAFSSTSTVEVPFNAGQTAWIRATLDVDNGAVGNTTTFYTSSDGATWVQLGSTVVKAGVTNIFNSGIDVVVGIGASGSSNYLDGKIYQALIYNGIAGTLAGSMVAEDAAIGAASWASIQTGETWTVNGSASISGHTVMSGLTNAKWQYENFSTSGGSFLLAVNGADKLRGYDGTSWWTDGDGTHDITGVDTATCIQICISHRRVWLVQKNTLKVWYLPVDSIAGLAVEFNLRSLAGLGGYLMAMGNWTIDSGTGSDDLAAFITSEGQVIVYRGIDPSNEVTWALTGVWNVGSPFSRRCLMKYAGDMLLLSVDGLYAMSSYLQSDRVNAKSALSDKIQNAVNSAVSAYSANFGWEVQVFQSANQIILNVPVNDGSNQEQYVMNSLTGAWCRFTGWDANCFAVFNDELYFGGNDYVAKAWSGFSDNVSNIETVAKQAFNYFGSRGQTKRWTMMRPILNVSGSPSILANINTDYATDTPTTPLSFTDPGYAAWDVAEWDSGVWGGGLNIVKFWVGVNGTGYCAAPVLQSASSGIEVHWMATDMVMEAGGIL